MGGEGGISEVASGFLKGDGRIERRFTVMAAQPAAR